MKAKNKHAPKKEDISRIEKINNIDVPGDVFSDSSINKGNPMKNTYENELFGPDDSPPIEDPEEVENRAKKAAVEKKEKEDQDRRDAQAKERRQQEQEDRQYKEAQKTKTGWLGKIRKALGFEREHKKIIRRFFDYVDIETDKLQRASSSLRRKIGIFQSVEYKEAIREEIFFRKVKRIARRPVCPNLFVTIPVCFAVMLYEIGSTYIYWEPTGLLMTTSLLVVFSIILSTVNISLSLIGGWFYRYVRFNKPAPPDLEGDHKDNKKALKIVKTVVWCLFGLPGRPVLTGSNSLM